MKTVVSSSVSRRRELASSVKAIGDRGWKEGGREGGKGALGPPLEAAISGLGCWEWVEILLLSMDHSAKI